MVHHYIQHLERIINLNTVDDLVNGATGTIIAVEYKENNLNCIIVKFDDPSVGKNFRKENLDISELKKYSNGIPIFKERLGYKSSKKASSKQSGKDLYVRQYPLNLAFASTGNVMNFGLVHDVIQLFKSRIIMVTLKLIFIIF